MMNTFLKVSLTVLVTALVLTGCSSSSDPEGKGTVEMDSVIDNGTVTGHFEKNGDRVEGQSELDSVSVERVRILISRLKFQSATDDTGSGGQDVKSGPAVVTFDINGVNSVFKEPVPTGTYDRMKLEKHKFSASEADEYEDDPVFGDFAFPERLTLIMEGSTHAGDTERAFSINDASTENLWLDFDPELVVEEGGSVVIDLVFDARVVFNDNGRVLDPFDSKDLRDISKNLKKALRMQNR